MARACWKRMSEGRAVPAPSWEGVNGHPLLAFEGLTDFNDLVASHQLINVLARPAVEEETGQVVRALPRLEAALVDAGAEVGGLDLVDDGLILGAPFAEQLRADVEELAAGEVHFPSGRRFDADGAVAEAFRERVQLGVRALVGTDTVACARPFSSTPCDECIVMSPSLVRGAGGGVDCPAAAVRSPTLPPTP